MSLLICMLSFYMRCQYWLLFKFSIALMTFIWFLSSMSSFMHFPIWFSICSMGEISIFPYASMSLLVLEFCTRFSVTQLTKTQVWAVDRVVAFSENWNSFAGLSQIILIAIVIYIWHCLFTFSSMVKQVIGW